MSKTDELKEKKVSLFDFIGDISQKKQYLLDDDTKGVYTQYMVNKAFSQHIDTVMLASEMNKRPTLSIEMHHDFLFYSIDPKGRFGKWAKKQETDDVVISYLKEKYSINNEHAIDYAKLLDNDTIEQIRKRDKLKGGRYK
jgi:hypothetical protein